METSEQDKSGTFDAENVGKSQPQRNEHGDPPGGEGVPPMGPPREESPPLPPENSGQKAPTFDTLMAQSPRPTPFSITFRRMTATQVEKVCIVCKRSFFTSRRNARDKSHCSQTCVKITRLEKKMARAKARTEMRMADKANRHRLAAERYEMIRKARIDRAHIRDLEDRNSRRIIETGFEKETIDAVHAVSQQGAQILTVVNDVKRARAMAPELRLTPSQASIIRGRVAQIASAHLEIANEVLKGTVMWSPTQARLFSLLLDKVVPNLSASFHQTENITKRFDQLTREELELIASGDKSITVQGDFDDPEQASGSVTIEHEPEPTGSGDGST